MDEKKKKQLNRAISIIREECRKHKNCFLCPLERSGCEGTVPPCNWTDIE